MNNSTQSRSISVRSAWVFAVGIGLINAVHGAEPQTVAERVSSLRGDLRENQRSYLVCLSNQGAADLKASEYISFLRDDLRALVTKRVDAVGGGEVELAFRSAAVKLRLSIIHVYEENFGDRSISRTTEWNVFASDELQTLRKGAQSNLKRLLEPAVVVPDSEVPLKLKSRIRELRSQLESLHSEVSNRAEGIAPKLREIDPSITLADARSKFPVIDSVDGSGAKIHAEHVLHFEVKMRSVGLPYDASLQTLVKDVAWLPGIDIEAGRGNRGPPWMTDPPPPPAAPVNGGPKNRGPPSFPGQLNELVFEELDATRTRDPLQRAQARAKIATNVRIVSTVLECEEVSSLVALDDAQLNQLRDGYSDWRKKIVLESATNRSAQALVEIDDVDTHLRQISEEFSRRTSTSTLRGESQILKAMRLVGESPASASMSASQEVDYQIELRQSLGYELDAPREIPDPRIRAAYNKAVVESLRAESTRLNALWDEATEVERVVLRNGRGSAAAKVGASVVQAKRDLRAGARELSQRISRTFADSTTHSIPPLNQGLLLPSKIETTSSNSVSRVAATLVESRMAVTQLIESSGTNQLQVRAANGPARAVNFRRAKTSTPTATSLKPTEYEKFFPQNEKWTRDYKKLTEETIEGLRRAPGGVIVDATLAGSLLRQIDEIRIDLKSNSLQMRSGETWRTISPRIDPETLRTAYAFVLDGRVAAVDLREPTVSEFTWLFETAIPDEAVPRSSQEEISTIRKVLRSMTSIHLHPCLLNTDVGCALIAADQLVFDLLPIANVRREADEFKSGLSLVPLREAYATDNAAAVSDPRYSEALFYKSILSTREVSQRWSGGTARLRSHFDFRVFHIPIRYRRTGEWFDRNQEVLKAVRPELSLLERFTIGVAICRCVRVENVENNFDILATVECPPAVTPRFTIAKSLNLDRDSDAILRRIFELPAENQPSARAEP